MFVSNRFIINFMIVKFTFTFEVDRVESVQMLGARLTETKIGLRYFTLACLITVLGFRKCGKK